MNNVPLSLSWGSTHEAQILKHEFRSKASAQTYFNGLGGANTLVFYGTEGVDYEFHADHGFRTKTQNGAAEIRLSNIITDPELKKYMIMSGFSAHFDVLTSEWCEPDSSAYLFPIKDLIGTAAASTGYLWQIANNDYFLGPFIRVLNDMVTYRAKGRNKMQYSLGPSSTTPAQYGRPISMYNKPTYSTIQLTKDAGVGNAWFDGIPFAPPHGSLEGNNFNSPHGVHLTLNLQRSEIHAVGTFSIWLGNGTTFLGDALNRWIRNIRFFTRPISCVIHPALAQVHSMGDSFSATTLGPQGVVTTTNSVGATWHPGEMTVNQYADIDAGLTLCRALAKRGFIPGSMNGGGQGGKAFYDTLDSEGWRAQFINYHPTMVFTHGLNNDISLIASSAMTIAQLKTKIFDLYILPVMQRGCYGWGWVIPAFGKASTTAQITAHAAVTAMLLAFPADWDIAYPQYAGKVKVRDVRAIMGWNGTSFVSSKYWKSYWEGAADEVHPSAYGGALFGEKSAEMALEFIGK